MDPRTAILPPNSPRSSANLGAVHLSDARDVTIVGNTFRQTTGRITRAIALVGYEYGILASTEPAQAARGLFAVPQGPAHVRIEQNTFIGFPATAAHDTVFVRSWPGTTAPGVVIRNNKFRQGHTSDIADPGAAIGVGNLDHPDISGNTITGHYLGIDLSGSSVAGGTVAGNRISNTGDTEFPAAITVDPGVTDTAISGTISSGYTHVVAGTPGTGTTVIG